MVSSVFRRVPRIFPLAIDQLTSFERIKSVACLPMFDQVNFLRYLEGINHLPIETDHFDVTGILYRVRVSGLPKYATEQMIRDFYEQFGKIMKCYLVRDKLTLGSCGIAHIAFANKKSMEEVLLAQPHIFDGIIVHARPDQEFRIIIDGLSPSTTKESLLQFYSKFGRPFNCNIAHYPARNIHHGFLSFSSKEEFDNAMATRPHVIDGNTVEVDLLAPGELTLCIRELSPATTDKKLSEFYSKYGTLLECIVKRDKNTNESRGFGFVVFSSEYELQDALRSQPHVIDDKVVKLFNDEKDLKLFVGRLSPATTEESFSQFFSKFGKIYECRIARNKQTNQLRDFGFVWFATRKAMNDALISRPHVIDGKQVDSKVSGRRGGKDCVLFVGGISPFTTDEALLQYFSRFGSVVHYEVKRHAVTGHSKGFGYVTFSDVEEVQKALRLGPHMIDGRMVNIGFVDPTAQKPMKLPVRNLAARQVSGRRGGKDCVLFVGGISPFTTDEALLQYFSRFGSVVHYEVKRHAVTGHSRGFGYVTFSDVEEVQKALRLGPHMIDGRMVNIGFVDPTAPKPMKLPVRNLAARQVSGRRGGKDCVLFVGGISPFTTDEALLQYFSRFGSVVHYEVKRHAVTGHSRGFGYVTFSDVEEVQKALRLGPHMIDGRMVNIGFVDPTAPKPMKLPVRKLAARLPLIRHEQKNLKEGYIFGDVTKLKPHNLGFWKKWDEERELIAKKMLGPRNAIEEEIELTKQGKMWPYPINNEYMLGAKEEESFVDHVFLEPAWAEHGVPRSKSLDHFMELVLVGLSKNPHMSVKKKRSHIEWFANYFKQQMPSKYRDVL